MVKSCSRLFKVSVQIYETSSHMFHFQITNCLLLMDTSLRDSPTGKSHAFKSSLMNKKSLQTATQNICTSIPDRFAALLPPSTLSVQKLLFICQPKKYHAFTQIKISSILNNSQSLNTLTFCYLKTCFPPMCASVPKVNFSLQVFRLKSYVQFSYLQYMLHALPILFSLIFSPQSYSVRSTNYKGAHYAVLYILPLLPPFST